MITAVRQKKAAADFVAFWMDKGYEKGHSQKFWLALLRDVYGVEHPEQYIDFEDQVKLDASTGFIDGYIPRTKVMIEQKSRGVPLNKEIKQSSGLYLTPLQQAQQYIMNLPVSLHPTWSLTT